MKVLMTGGHHSSALPLIKLIRKTRPDIEIFWVGHKHSAKGDTNDTLEYREISELNIPFYNLLAGKFYKTFDPIRLLKIPFGFTQAFYYLVKIKPNVIMSFGGYLAVPVVYAGYLLGIPSITHEQTVVSGYANKLISIVAKKILVSWESSLKYFPSNKTIFSGIPLRSSIFELRSNSFINDTNLPLLFVMGGKTGSHILNKIVLDSLDILLTKYTVIHQCGDNSMFNDYVKLSTRYDELKNSVPGKYFLRKFVLEDEIGEAYSKASVVLSRAGAHTISELKALGKKCVLIPIPWVSHNEQMENALVLNDYGLATILKEDTLTTDTLLQALNIAAHLKPVISKEASEIKTTPEQVMLTNLLQVAIKP